MKRCLVLLCAIVFFWGCGDPRIGMSYGEVLRAIEDTVHFGYPRIEVFSDSTICYLDRDKCLRRNIYTDSVQVIWDLKKPNLYPHLAEEENGKFLVFYRYEVPIDEYNHDYDIVWFEYHSKSNKLYKTEFLYKNGFYHDDLHVSEKDVKREGDDFVLTTSVLPSKEIGAKLGDLYRIIRFRTIEDVGWRIASDSTYLSCGPYGFQTNLLYGDDVMKNIDEIIIPNIVKEHFVPIEVDCLTPVDYLMCYQDNKAFFKREYQGDFIEVEGVVTNITEYYEDIWGGRFTTQMHGLSWVAGYAVSLEIAYIATDHQEHKVYATGYIPKSRNSETESLAVGYSATLYGNVSVDEGISLFGSNLRLELNNATTTQPRRSYTEAKKRFESVVHYVP